jgi:hypothetical protein
MGVSIVLIAIGLLGGAMFAVITASCLRTVRVVRGGAVAQGRVVSRRSYWTPKSGPIAPKHMTDYRIGFTTADGQDIAFEYTRESNWLFTPGPDGTVTVHYDPAAPGQTATADTLRHAGGIVVLMTLLALADCGLVITGVVRLL